MARARGSFERGTLYGLTAEQERTAFFNAFGIKAEDLKGKTLLDAGCGDGFLLELISGYGAEIVGLDINTAISVAFRRCRDLPDVTVIQGDIFEPCFMPVAFDFVWCEGVVVHTPDPAGAFRSLCRLVKPGGQLYLWVYPSERLSIYQRIRDILVASYRIPYPLLLGLSYLFACGLFPVLKLSSRRRSLNTIMFDLFDNLSPRYQWRFTEAAICSWFKESGFIDVKVNGRIGVSGRLASRGDE
jgi:SAM-dependent methyltransferase